MSRYATCTNCAVDRSSCQRLANVRAAIKGQGVTSLKFRCADRQSLFSPGQRVQFDWSLWDSVEHESYELPLTFNGTVLRERGTKFVVQVDRDADASGEGIQASEVFTKNDQLLIKVKPSDMRLLDEPIRATCSTCYWVEGAAEDRCYRMTGLVPNGCIEPARVQP